MFDPLVDKIHEKITPISEQWQEVFGVYAGGVMELLDQIQENTAEPQFQTQRNRRYFNLNAANNRTATFDVPTAEDWELDYVAVIPTAATNIILRQGGLLVFANNFGNPQTMPDVGAVVQGGSQLTITASADAEITLVFTAEIPKPGKKAKGRGELSLRGRQSMEGGVEPSRHLAPGLDLIRGGVGDDRLGTNNTGTR